MAIGTGKKGKERLVEIIMDDEKVKMMIDLRIQNYFDHYLKETLPKILDIHTQTCPHGQRVGRVKWFLIGSSITIGIAIPTFGRTILSILFKI